MKLQEITKILPVEVKRDAEFGSVGLITYEKANMLVFIERDEFLDQLFGNPNVSCVITTKDLAAILPNKYGILISSNPRKSFYQLHNYLALKTSFYWKDFTSNISTDARIYPNAYIAPKNVRIGRGTIIEPGVRVLEHSIIGEDVILRAGCTIGSEGFEFKQIEGEVFKVTHAGGIRLSNRVEVQANCAISRSVFGEFTELGEDTKLDNLVHIAHNVKIGERCLLAACAMIAGSVTIGDDVWIGPGASISNGITIGNRAQVTIGSVVTKDVSQDQKVTGNFAIDHKKFLEFLKNIR
jgi:UDP-3-O-[3-hydroxymyristoyl] glucosamine N-acyltransferase